MAPRAGHLVAPTPSAQPGTLAAVDARPRWRCPLVAGIAVLSAVSALSTAMSPALLDTPLLLIALSPRLPFLALASTHTAPLTFLVVAVARLLVADPLYYAIGRRHGSRAVDRLPGRFGSLTKLALRGAPIAVLVRPIGRHLVLAGAAPTRTWVIAAADLAGTVGYVLAVQGAVRTIG